MKPGPPRKPHQLKVLEGTDRSDRMPRNPPSPEPAVPSCPTWLGREATRLWKRLAPELAALGLLTKADRATFAAYCQAYHDWWDLEKRKADAPPTFTTDSGYVQKHPVWAMATDARERVVKLGREFGMTPAARSGIELPAPPEPDRDRAFLQAKHDDRAS